MATTAEAPARVDPIRADVDPIGAAMSSVEAQAAAQAQSIALGFNLPNGRRAEMLLPVPLTPQDVCQILVALADVITGRITEAAQEAPDIASRLAARGIVVPHG